MPTASFSRPTTDREGEPSPGTSSEALKSRRVLKGKPVERVTFNAITKDAVAHAMANPREIDQALVDAYLARRALDYLVASSFHRCSGGNCLGALGWSRAIRCVAIGLRSRGGDRALRQSPANTGRWWRRSPPPRVSLRGPADGRGWQEDHQARCRHESGGRGVQGGA